MTVDHLKTGHRIIQSFEADQLKNRSAIIKLADWLTSSFGSVRFLVFNIVFFICWIYVNTGRFPSIPIFDPFPFTLLTMIVSLEAIFLSIIVLMSQNKQAQISTLREELDMQVNLISEQEITMMLKMIKKIAEKMDIKIDDHEFHEMTNDTDVSYIQHELQEQLNKLNESPIPKIPEKLNPLSKK